MFEDIIFDKHIPRDKRIMLMLVNRKRQALKDIRNNPKMIIPLSYTYTEINNTFELARRIYYNIEE
jgi:hypothetical protein